MSCLAEVIKNGRDTFEAIRSDFLILNECENRKGLG
jgi:hypothetical protein